MAKYRRYRKYTRRNRKTWSTRLTNISVSQLTTAGVPFFIYRTLATNPAQDDNTVSQRFTVKNVHAQVNIELTDGLNTVVENLQHYIMYVPQGYTLNESTPYDHPEWIMAHRFLGSPLPDANNYYPPQTLFSRLARKLDTGDRVVYLLLGSNTGSGSGNNATIYVNGIVKLNTKAN